MSHASLTRSRSALAPRLAQRALALTVALLLAGCASLTRHWIAPEVAVRSIAPERLDAERQSLLVGLRITNPNDRTLPIKAMTYRLALEDRPVASGGGALERQLAAGQSADVVVTLNTDLVAVLPLLPTLALVNRPLRYRIDGTAKVAGVLPLPFRHEGEIDAAAALRRALRGAGPRRGALLLRADQPQSPSPGT